MKITKFIWMKFDALEVIRTFKVGEPIMVEDREYGFFGGAYNGFTPSNLLLVRHGITHSLIHFPIRIARIPLK